MLWIGIALVALAVAALITLACMAASLHSSRNPYEKSLNK